MGGVVKAGVVMLEVEMRARDKASCVVGGKSGDGVRVETALVSERLGASCECPRPHLIEAHAA
jgi:hypothetical protein